jgi:hypothetical protein
MKLFPSARIPTDTLPECRPHIERGDHRRIHRFSADDHAGGPARRPDRRRRRRRRAKEAQGLRPRDVAQQGGQVVTPRRRV